MEPLHHTECLADLLPASRAWNRAVEIAVVDYSLVRTRRADDMPADARVDARSPAGRRSISGA
jgi:hypothetical protein